jgi:MacB-like periplasmic core domain
MAQNLHEVWLRTKALFLKRRMERDMADELAFHQALLREKLLRQGASAEDAATVTRKRFGDVSRWQERLREVWQFQRFENLLRDISFSARVLRKSPGFTAVAILTLALGVAANTTVFSMINGLRLRPLPVPGSDRLAVFGTEEGQSQTNYSFSEPLFRGLEHRHQTFSEVFGFNYAKLQLQGSSGTEEVEGQLVSGKFFSALQTAPLLGRTLTPTDDQKGGNPAGFGAVISEGFWKRWFNRAPNVIGEKLRINNTLFTVVGVMPKRFIGADPLERPELFLPLATEPALSGTRSMTEAGFHAWWLTLMGRLQPDVAFSRANAEAGAMSDAVLHEVIPDQRWIADRENRHFQFFVEPGSAGFTHVRLIFRKPLIAVFAMCGGILLLACLNLASLLMARGGGSAE